MKRIFNQLNKLEHKGYYYRAIITPEHIDIKLYLNNNHTDTETNFAVKNTQDGRYEILFSLETFYYQLTK